MELRRSCGGLPIGWCSEVEARETSACESNSIQFYWSGIALQGNSRQTAPGGRYVIGRAFGLMLLTSVEISSTIFGDYSLQRQEVFLIFSPTFGAPRHKPV